VATSFSGVPAALRLPPPPPKKPVKQHSAPAVTSAPVSTPTTSAPAQAPPAPVYHPAPTHKGTGHGVTSVG
jgi:hypothetical protein